jgi:quercetin dioxygenase-like cupin family protein
MKTIEIAALGIALGLGGVIATPAWSAEYTSVTPADIKWVDAPSIGPGAKTAVIHGDPKSSALFVMRIKVPAKTNIKVHTHPAQENVTILSGTLYFAAGDKFDAKKAKAYGPGSYFSIDQGKPMFAFTKDKETVAQIHGVGPWGITYLDPKDKPAMKK